MLLIINLRLIDLCRQRWQQGRWKQKRSTYKYQKVRYKYVTCDVIGCVRVYVRVRVCLLFSFILLKTLYNVTYDNR